MACSRAPGALSALASPHPVRRRTRPPPRVRSSSRGSSSSRGAPGATDDRSALASDATVRPMRQGDLSPVVATLVEAADPEKVSAAALAAYALEASQAPATRETALVATLAPTPLDSSREQVVGVVGVLLSDDLFPAEMRIRGSDAAYVTNLAVASRARRRGVASRLLVEAERFASENGRSTVWCRVDDDNATAREMYARRGYAPREPPRLLKYRDVVSTAYGFAGLAHFVDLVVGNSVLASAAGAPGFWEMSGLQKALAMLWCALGPASAACVAVGKKRDAPEIAVAGLVAYGFFETALACSCAFLFGAKGGDAATGAVAVQAVVVACYRALAPGAQGGKLSLAKTVEPFETRAPPGDKKADAEERFASLFLGFRARKSASPDAGLAGSDSDDTSGGTETIRSGTDPIRFRVLGDGKEHARVAEDAPGKRDPRADDGWVAETPEPTTLRRESEVAREENSSFEDYERDASGRVVYAARGFFYDGVRPSDSVTYGMTERVKVAVGIVGKRRERVFALRKTLGRRDGVAGAASEVFAVTMERPLGVVVERDTDGRTRVADFVEGSRAGRAAAVAQLQGLNETAGARAPKRGDVVRAFTTTTLSYGPRAQLLGDLSGTKRAVVLFGADDQPWGKTIGALKNGLIADGPVTLILERDLDPARAAAWTPEPTPEPTPELRRGAPRRSRDGGFSALAGRSSANRVPRAVGDPVAGNDSNAVGAKRERVSAMSSSGVPDPVNASLVVAAAAFVLLIATGFS